MDATHIVPPESEFTSKRTKPKPFSKNLTLLPLEIEFRDLLTLEMEELEGDASEAPATVRRSQRRGFLSRIWRGIFGGVSNEDYEKKLQRLSKEEAAVHAKMKSRALSWRRRARNVIFFSATFEVVAVAIAVIALRSLDITGSMKFIRTLPAILLPGLSYVVYSALESLTRLLDRKDQKTLERLRAERKAKIDELKEMTNYYTTQQLIQRYDLDPAAKVAAATALASRLGAESGLKFYIGDEPTTSVETTKSNNFEQAQSSVLRNRKQPPTRGGTLPQLSEASNDVESIQQGNAAVAPGPLVVEHYRGSGTTDGGWIARIAALLIGEDPSQCYALICGNCRRHNGLAKAEDFLHITYYCPHCHALNTSKQTEEQDVPYRSGTSPTQALGGSSARSGSKASSVTSVEGKDNVPEDIQE